MIDTTHWSLTTILVVHGILGLVIGSFLSMLSYRMVVHLESDTSPLLKALMMDRSRCASCQQPLTAWQLIPLISWLSTKGKATCCSSSISVRYPLIELATAVLSIVTVWHFYLPSEAILGLSWQGWSALLLLWTLITISITDFEHQLIPDRLSLPLLWLGLLINSTSAGFTSLSDAVWGAALGYASLWLVFQLHRAITGKEGMGYGDFKLTAALGAWLGMSVLMPLFILAGSMAVLVMGSFMLLGKHQLANAFPFGPWLAMAGWLVLVGLSPV